MLGLEQYVGDSVYTYRRNFVTHIIFNVKLDEYDGTVCGSAEDEDTRIRSNTRTWVQSPSSNTVLIDTQ